MRYENVAIMSVSHVDAPHRIPSSAIEDWLAPTLSRLGVPKGLLEGLSGIAERRFWDAGTQPSDVATQAAEQALTSAGLDRAKLGVLVNTSVCRDYIEPSVACLVHGNLGLSEECKNFDLGNACLGFMDGMEVVGNMIERGQVDYGIVVDGESSRFPIEQTVERLNGPDVDEQTFRENFATLTLGSGSAAMVLARADMVPDGHRFNGTVSLSNTKYNRLCRGQVDGMVTDTRNLLMAGIELASRTWQRAIDEFKWTMDTLDQLVLHQVSKSHTEKLVKALELDFAKVFAIFPEYGNIGPASVPIVLSKLAEAGRLVKGDRIALMGIGSGLNCTMADIVW